MQAIGKDILYKHANLNLLPVAQRDTAQQRLTAHLDSTLGRLCSYLQYIGLVKYRKAIDVLCSLQEINLS
jgi:hypothetical protein